MAVIREDSGVVLGESQETLNYCQRLRRSIVGCCSSEDNRNLMFQAQQRGK